MHTAELSTQLTKNGNLQASEKAALYALLQKQLAALLEGERDMIANFANAAALLWYSLPEINWSGFYLHKRIAGGAASGASGAVSELVLGPFQGKPACVRIALGKGVCGTSAARRETLLVDDVEAFPGHIACDAASRSEIVVPMVHGGVLIGVLDVDSPVLSRFDAADKQGLERLVALLLEATDFHAADAIAGVGEGVGELAA
jgi:L-methionine (R)-S-oxide reductase